MKQPKRILVLSSCEYQQMLHGLIQFRNKLIQQGRYTNAVDDLLIKLQKARRCRQGMITNAVHASVRHLLSVRLFPCGFPVLLWCKSGLLFEKLYKIVYILDAAVCGNILNRFCGHL